MSKTPDTKRKAYRRIRENGEDVSLRKRVAAQLALQPATRAQLATEFPEKSNNAIRPRVDELVRMGCVVRDGKAVNPSGHEAYLHHITDLGERYLRGTADPKPKPPVSDLKSDVVKTARAFLAGAGSKADLQNAVQAHDSAKRQRDPEWEPEYAIDAGLSAEERKRIAADPVLQVSDFA